jgi:hypothetical protein
VPTPFQARLLSESSEPSGALSSIALSVVDRM